MTLAASVPQLIADNALFEAIERLKSHLKTAPADKPARHLYIDLLILAGEYGRADAQCNLASSLAPEDMMGFGVLRNQLRAMAAREAWFADAEVPEFPQGPSDLDKLAIRLGLAHRAGTAAEAKAVLEELEALRGERAFSWNGRPIADVRDLDDRIPHALEAIMSGGAYLWVDLAKIASVKIEPIARPRDLAFRRAELTLTDGASAPVLLPAIYHGTTGNETLLLGRQTEWVAERTGITTGRGQRCLLAGDDVVSFHDAVTLAAAENGDAVRGVVHG
ncbi:type VI secretion system accessory protein TagJ [Sinorhizobium americanum]|uniref:Protein of avirulence locus ImpE n=1 Tax=Sinorhizobium americanum TaxID=194963 RepID=A0A1L3M004_9HYPH|nr:type VI secretion system accessory protein TagJ [Sinorhizobium americanum]APG95613.1 protein of avirulence locus ImpE [Sinorhizobium americanum]OAP46087.1 nitrogen fixation protein [Sinorhizobium americanum]